MPLVGRPEMVRIIRKAVLQEDEGREHFIAEMPKEQAEKWVAAQAGEWHPPSDYRMEPV